MIMFCPFSTSHSLSIFAFLCRCNVRWNMTKSAAAVIVLVVGSMDIVSGLNVPGPFQPSRNNILGYVAVEDNMHVELDIVVHSFPSAWANIFRIGKDDAHRYPALFLNPNSGTPGNGKAGFYFSLADGALGCSTGELCQSLGGALVAEQSYHVEIDFDQSTFKVTIDNTLVYDDTVNQHALYDSAPCYVSDSDYLAADVTISNFAVSDQSPVTCAADAMHQVTWYDFVCFLSIISLSEFPAL